LFAALAAAAAYRLVALRHATPVGLESPALTGLTQAIVIWRYVALLVVPLGQGIMHGVHRVGTLADPVGWIALAGLTLVAFGAFAARRTAPLATFGIVWFFAVLAPSSSVVALREGMAEHRVYLASAGLLTAGAAGVARLLARDGSRRTPAAGYGWALCLVLVVCSLLTVRRNHVWASPVSLWSEAIVRAEGMWEPHYALADTLRDSGNCDAAIGEYRQVLVLRPAHRDALTNLGICLGQTGKLDEAEAAFKRALEIDPSFVRGYTNLGALALVAGNAERARDYYLQAIETDAGNVLARMQLAALYEKAFHDYHSAARMCGEARRLAPATPGVVECVERNQRLAAGR
jgi:cytochrome c-type biogenesis protein CcmH/NrfG